jgi:hypothetical protein
MVSRASATLNLVTRHDAQPTFLTVDLEGHAELAGESGRVRHHDSQALRSASCSADQ